MANRISGVLRIPPISEGGGGGGTPGPHTHDDRYYTKSQINAMLHPLILESPDGEKWALTVTDEGVLVAVPLTGGGDPGDEYGTEVFGGGAFGDGPYPA